MKISRVGIDLVKNVFQLQSVEHKGKAVWKRRLKRDKWLDVLCQSVDPDCEISMEASAGAHHWVVLPRFGGHLVKCRYSTLTKHYYVQPKKKLFSRVQARSRFIDSAVRQFSH